MPEFDIDQLKKNWQKQDIPPKYGNSEILEMLNKKSRNYVKYIFWISLAEFLIFFGITLYYVFIGDDSGSFINILQKLGIEKTPKLEADISHLYFILKVVSLLMTAVFVVIFYKNYRKIQVEDNLKKFIIHIIGFKKTVNIFILANIFLLVASVGILTKFMFSEMASQNITMDHSTFVGFLVGLGASLVLCIGLIWFYYSIVYGIIMNKLGKNLDQLREIETEN